MMIKIIKYCLIILLFNIFSIKQTMSYEEPKYKTIKTSDVYEIREYDDRLAVEIEYSNEDSGFRYLFNYISGENKSSEKVKMTVPVTQSVKINMTTPVTQSTQDGKMKMQFFLPSKFTLENAPQPTNKRVNLIIIKGGVYAVISYSGRLTNRNYSTLSVSLLWLSKYKTPALPIVFSIVEVLKEIIGKFDIAALARAIPNPSYSLAEI